MIELDVSLLLLLVVMLVEGKGRCCDELYEVTGEEVWCLTCCTATTATGAAVLSWNRVAHCVCACDVLIYVFLFPLGSGWVVLVELEKLVEL